MLQYHAKSSWNKLTVIIYVCIHMLMCLHVQEDEADLEDCKSTDYLLRLFQFGEDFEETMHLIMNKMRNIYFMLNLNITTDC